MRLCDGVVIMRAAIAPAILLACTATAHAETEVRVEPPIGEERTAPVGSLVWQEYQFEGTIGVIIDTPVNTNWGRAETVDLPAGSALVILRERRLKACRTVTHLRNIGTKIWSDCLFDLDDDGRFERVSYNSSGASKRLDPPVAYRRDEIEMVGDAGSSNFRKELRYLGSDRTSLKLSYREFSNDIARPAFSEDLEIPLGETFPQDIAVKNQVITLFGIDGMGLRYAIAAR